MASVVPQLEGRDVRGVIVEQGGVTSHASILARALGIPMLVHVTDASPKISAGDQLILDGLAGRVFVNPDEEIQCKYKQLETDLLAHHSALKGLIREPAVTSDGVGVKLCANIGQSADAAAAANVNADGIGLYRTEFVFLVQDRFPSEEEQYQIYRATAEHVPGREIVIRVLDIGSDKPLPYFPLTKEANPALGSRGTRLLLKHPAAFQSQLRAVLRLSGSYPVSILFPMIGGLDELRAAKAAVERAKESLREESKAFNPRIPIGVMVETPSAATLIHRLAPEADFLSVGTNDLIQYLLASDRNGSDSWYEPLHPAVLKVLAKLVTAVQIANKPLSICGEIASDPAYTALLLGLGFRNFSVSPGKLLEIKHAIRSICLGEAEFLAEKILALDSVTEIKALVLKDWERRNPVSSPVVSELGLDTEVRSPVAHNVSLQRFEFCEQGVPPAFLSYTRKGNRVFLEHTFVPKELRGKGLAGQLARAALDEARRQGWRVIPHCSYVDSFIKRNPGFADLLAHKEPHAIH
jgi:phosphotransferase system enzyme I (PtsI)